MGRQDDLRRLLHECVQNHGREINEVLHVDDDTPLLGPDSPLNSIGLVMVVTSFEARINEKFGTQIVLASEQAMSMKRSPFRSIDALSDYAEQLIAANAS